MRQRGHTTLEVLVILAIIGVLLGTSIPALDALTLRAQMRQSCLLVAEILRQARQQAITLDRGVGVRFERGHPWTYSVYIDGDGDGVRNDDIRRGIDTPLRQSSPLLRGSKGIPVGLPARPNLTDPDTGGPLQTTIPVAFGLSSICAFSPSGDGTPGSIYVTMSKYTGIVRCSGEGGTIRIYYFDPGRRRWTT